MENVRQNGFQVKYKIEVVPRMVRVKKTGCPPPCAPGASRGIVKGLSVPSGLRLQNAIASVNPAHGAPLFVTLTYPANYPGSWQTWKLHLDNFRRSLYDIPDFMVGAVWRLEAQRRGAPHYHVLLWHNYGDGKKVIRDFRKWCSECWYRVVGSGDVRHLKAGTQVKVIDSGEMLNGVMRYLGKYLGKDSVHPESQVFSEPVGRYWGVWGRKELMLEPKVLEIDQATFSKARRILSAYREAKAKEYCRKKNLTYKKGHGKQKQKLLQGKGQKSMPGVRCFLDSESSKRLIDHLDIPPF